jgi:hypothetical protein
MSPTSLSFRSANIHETTDIVSKGPEKDIFITSPLLSPVDVLKDVRAYERDRQRVKKAAELVKARERKERSTFAGKNTWSPWGDKTKTSVAKLGKSSWFGGKGSWDGENEKGEKDRLETEQFATLLRVASEKDSLDGEVKLADLVTSRKPRKNKGGFDLVTESALITTHLIWIFQKGISKSYQYYDKSLSWTILAFTTWTLMSPGSM